MEKQRASPTDHAIQCLVCDKDIKLVFYPDSDLTSFSSAAFDGGVSCSTSGNYGSQVLDGDAYAHFVVCDSCWIKKSHKMLISTTKKQWHNARDFYEDWLSRLSENPQTEDLKNYLKAITPYFNE